MFDSDANDIYVPTEYDSLISIYKVSNEYKCSLGLVNGLLIYKANNDNYLRIIEEYLKTVSTIDNLIQSLFIIHPIELGNGNLADNILIYRNGKLYRQSNNQHMLYTMSMSCSSVTLQKYIYNATKTYKLIKRKHNEPSKRCIRDYEEYRVSKRKIKDMDTCFRRLNI